MIYLSIFITLIINYESLDEENDQVKKIVSTYITTHPHLMKDIYNVK